MPIFSKSLILLPVNKNLSYLVAQDDSTADPGVQGGAGREQDRAQPQHAQQGQRHRECGHGIHVRVVNLADNRRNCRDIYFAKYYGKGGGNGQLGKKSKN